MAAQSGFIINMAFPNFTARNATPTLWSDSLVNASRPTLANVWNASSNIKLVEVGAVIGPLTNNPTTALHTKNHGTTRSRGFNTNHRGPCDIDAGGYDWFERIFLDPTSASIKVLNTTNLSLRVLSTYRNLPNNLSSITLDTGDGTSMSVEPAYVFTHNLLTYLDVVFTASAAGPSSYTGTITFDYVGGPEVFGITIVRVVEAPWRPLDKFTETIEWKTSILAARAFETRSALRELPRINYEYEFLLLARELDGFRAAASNPEVPIVTPLWYDEYYIGSVSADVDSVQLDTSTSEFIAGGYALILEEGGESEFLTVLAVTASSVTFTNGIMNNYTNATITSAALAVVLSASYTEYNNNVYKGKIKLLGHDAQAYPLAAQTQHDGVDVLPSPSVITKTLKGSFSTRGEYIDNGTGVVRFKHIEDRVRSSLEHLWKASGYAQRKAMKNWLYARVGRQKKFLIPTFQNDFFLASPYGGGASMDILATHYEPPFYFQVQLQSGDIHYGTCISKVSAGGVDSLVVNPIGVAFTDGDLDAFSIMFLSRYGSDKFTIRYKNHQIAELKTLTTGI